MDDIAEKKKAIFESTLELIREHGFHGTPMSLVAKRAGVAAGTIYHYFEGKDSLIHSLFEYNRSRMVDEVIRAMNEGGSYREKFYRIIRRVYWFYLDNPNVLVFFEQFMNSPYSKEINPEEYEHQPLCQFFIEGTETSWLKELNAELLLSVSLCTVASTAKLHMSERINITESELDGMIGVLWDGFSKSDLPHKPV